MKKRPVSMHMVVYIPQLVVAGAFLVGESECDGAAVSGVAGQSEGGLGTNIIPLWRE